MTLYYSLDNQWNYSLRTLKYTAVSTTLYIFPLWDLIPTFHFVVIFLSLAEAFEPFYLYIAHYAVTSVDESVVPTQQVVFS